MFSISGFNVHIWPSTILGLNDKILIFEQKTWTEKLWSIYGIFYSFKCSGYRIFEFYFYRESYCFILNFMTFKKIRNIDQSRYLFHQRAKSADQTTNVLILFLSLTLRHSYGNRSGRIWRRGPGLQPNPNSSSQLGKLPGRQIFHTVWPREVVFSAQYSQQ